MPFVFGEYSESMFYFFVSHRAFYGLFGFLPRVGNLCVLSERAISGISPVLATVIGSSIVIAANFII